MSSRALSNHYNAIAMHVLDCADLIYVVKIPPLIPSCQLQTVKGLFVTMALCSVVVLAFPLSVWRILPSRNELLNRSQRLMNLLHYVII